MSTPATYAEEALPPRRGEMPDAEALAAYLNGRLAGFHGLPEIRQYTGGYSNLTYLLTWTGGQCILRRPPAGADIRGGHDMSREYRVLRALKPLFPQVPEALLHCDDPSVIGAPFFLMERVEGRILRGGGKAPPPPGPEAMRALSQQSVRMLARLHDIDPAGTPLEGLGRPDGYLQRQTEGWIARYRRAATDEVDGIEETIAWMQDNMPAGSGASLIHNDFKYDNLVIDPADPTRIRAVLDWEMATLGDPLLDLGTTLAYWSEPGDPSALMPFNLTWLPGNLGRREVAALYAEARGIAEPDLLFPYVFGCFKVGVIVQQIYARYRKGLTADPRFAGLKAVLEAMVGQALRALRDGEIGSRQA